MLVFNICHNCGNSKVVSGQPCLNCGEIISNFSATELPSPSIIFQPLNINLTLDLSLSEKVLTNIRFKKLIADNNKPNPNVTQETNNSISQIADTDPTRNQPKPEALTLFNEENILDNDLNYRNKDQIAPLNGPSLFEDDNDLSYPNNVTVDINKSIQPSNSPSIHNFQPSQLPIPNNVASTSVKNDKSEPSLEKLVEDLTLSLNNMLTANEAKSDLPQNNLNESTRQREFGQLNNPSVNESTQQREFGQLNNPSVNESTQQHEFGQLNNPSVNESTQQHEFGQLNNNSSSDPKQNIDNTNQSKLNNDAQDQQKESPIDTPTKPNNNTSQTKDTVSSNTLNLLNFDFNPIPQESPTKAQTPNTNKTNTQTDYKPETSKGFDDFPSLAELNTTSTSIRSDNLKPKNFVKQAQNNLKHAQTNDEEDDDDENFDYNHPVKAKSGKPSAKKKSTYNDTENDPDDDPPKFKLRKFSTKNIPDDGEEEGEEENISPKHKLRKFSTKNKISNNGSDDDDDESEDNEKTIIKGNAKSPKSKSKKAKDSLDTDEDNDNVNLFNRQINILGISLPLTTILIIGFFGLFIFWQLVSGIGSIVGGLGSVGSNLNIMSNNNTPSLSGAWKFVAVAQGQKCEGYFNLEQSNNQIAGDGRDNNGNFEIIGTFTPPNKINFVKKYYVNGQEVFKPVNFDGLINFEQNPLYVQGSFNVTFRQNYGWRGHPVTVVGQWEGILAKPMNNQVTDNARFNKVHHIQSTGFNPLNNLTNSFTYAAVGGIGLAVFLIFYSIHLFGPNGKIQISEKQRYVTSQFKSQHIKMLKEMSAPYKIGGLSLGTRCEWKFFKFWEIKELAFTPKIRDKNPHSLILGTANKGKTRLVANFITQDILAKDRAVVVIDSDGGLVDLISQWIASHEKGKTIAKRVILLDPTQKNQKHSYNPLELAPDGNLQAAASSIVYGFKAIYSEPPGSQSQWNAQTANILRNSALLLTANGKTLTDLPTLLQDHDTRDILLEGVERKKREHIEFATLLETWGQYKKLARTEQWVNWVEPILNRVTPMLSDPRIRPILTHPNGTINLSEIITDKKILLVKIPQGQLDQNANLLGSLIVTGLKQAAINLSTQDVKNLNKTSLYLDEFDSFIEKETFDSLTSDTAKFQVGITAVAKSIQHLPEEYRNYLLIHVGSLIAFALAKKDADLLGPQMFRVDGRKRKHQTMQNFFNRVNSSPQFEMISDEEKLNIDRLIGQDDRTYFAYRVGSIAGVFHLKAPDFKDANPTSVSKRILDNIRGIS